MRTSKPVVATIGVLLAVSVAAQQVRDEPAILKNGTFVLSGTVSPTAVLASISAAAKAILTVTGTTATSVAAGFRSQITNSTATVGTTGHMIGGLLLATDTTSGRTTLYGAEGRVDGRSTDAAATHSYVGGIHKGLFQGASLSDSVLVIGTESDVSITTDGSTPLAHGLEIGSYVPAMVGGLTKYSFYAAQDPYYAGGGMQSTFFQALSGPKVLISGSGTNATQLGTTQTTVPTCTSNCGTGSPTVVGTDTAGIVTLGTTPASGWIVTFNGTWAAAPSCTVQMALAGMVAGKQPLTVATTTTTMTVVTNGSAPSSADKYAYLCIGVS